jgi:hypothetical protein
MAYIGRPQFNKPVICSAMNLLSACCDDNVSELIGELSPRQTCRWSFVYRKGAMPVTDMVLIAQSLIQNGIIGKAKVRKLQRDEGGKATTAFNAFEYSSAARTGLKLARDEAEKLTMTEFQMLLAAKFPDQKGFTKEEYDAVADDYLARKARKIAQST